MPNRGNVESPFPVRLREETKEWLKDQAKKNFRSISGEIQHRLERTRVQDMQAAADEERRAAR